MKSTIVRFSANAQPQMKTTRIDVNPTPQTTQASYGYIHSADDARAYKMERSIKELSAYIRMHQGTIAAGRLAELSETLRKMRDDESELSRRRRAALGE
jgi:hypothetical protein